MKTSVETVTPTKARAYLALNSAINRPLREKWVEYLAQQIRSNNWQLTHQGIAFSDSGHLIDGQHRLSAIIRADKSVQMSVARDLSDEIFKVTDSGLRRASHDRIHFVDSAGQNVLICQVLTAYARYALNQSTSVPVSYLEDLFLKYSDSWLWLAGQFPYRIKIYGKATIMAAIAAYHVVDKQSAQEFCTGYKTGESLPAGSPVLALRRNIASGGGQHNEYWRAAAAIRAHYAGRTLRNIVEATEDIIGNKNGVHALRVTAGTAKKRGRPRLRVSA